jgi:CHRD domain
MLMHLRKTIISRVVLALAVLTIFAFSSAHAAPITYSVTLNGPSEVPVNASPGVGVATVIVDPVAHTLSINVTFSGLLGTTTASHIHAATAVPLAGTAGVATTTPYFAGFPIGVTSGAYSNVLDMTQASSYNPAYVAAHGGTTTQAETDLFAAIAAGKAYLNIHSQFATGGEIRGFLIPEAVATEPSTWGSIKALYR